MSARHSFGVEAEQMRPELAEIARLTAERDALAKRVEALRAGTSEIVRTGSYLERKYAQKMLAADDKAAQS